MKPGIYTDIGSTEYHADPCPTPSLSASIARILIQDSAMHAWWNHPRLNPLYQREEARHMDLGTIAHAMLLEGTNVAHVIQATRKEGQGKNRVDTGERVTDYKTKDAQEERDAARVAGKYPLLEHELPIVLSMVDACRRQLAQHKEASDAFTNGTPEATLIWQEPNGVWCRARLDWLHDTPVIDDLKTTAGSAHPDQVSRNLIRDGWHLQAAFYIRGLRALRYGGSDADVQFRFIVQETSPPFALSVIGCDPSVMALAEEQIRYAISKFGECLQSGIWPGYTDRIAYAEMPAWETEKWLARI